MVESDGGDDGRRARAGRGLTYLYQTALRGPYTYRCQRMLFDNHQPVKCDDSLMKLDQAAIRLSFSMSLGALMRCGKNGYARDGLIAPTKCAPLLDSPAACEIILDRIQTFDSVSSPVAIQQQIAATGVSKISRWARS